MVALSVHLRLIITLIMWISQSGCRRFGVCSMSRCYVPLTCAVCRMLCPSLNSLGVKGARRKKKKEDMREQEPGCCRFQMSHSFVCCHPWNNLSMGWEMWSSPIDSIFYCQSSVLLLWFYCTMVCLWYSFVVYCFFRSDSVWEAVDSCTVTLVWLWDSSFTAATVVPEAVC